MKRAGLLGILLIAGACGDETALSKTPAGTGRLSGRVLFRGKHTRAEIDIPRGSCRKYHPQPPLEEDIVVGPDGGLRDVLVYIKAGLDTPYPLPTEPARLDQQACIFRPHVLAIVAGQDLKLINSDDAFHNVHIFARSNGERNYNLPPRSTRVIRSPFAEPELKIPVGCDQHSWMESWFHVLSHPKFYVTGPDGRWVISGLPAGRYTLAALHPELGEQTLQVTLRDGQEKSGLDFTFKKN